MKDLKNISWIYGKCTPITQLTPAGLIQDMLLNTLKLPNFCVNDAQFKKDALNFFKNEFAELNDRELHNLLNFLYPDKSDSGGNGI